TFFEVILNNWVSLLSAVYFLSRKKLDHLILTEKRIIVIIRNKVHKEYFFSDFETINYNGNNSVIEVIDLHQQLSIPLTKLKISYEESNILKHQLSEFLIRKKKI
ncbi:MAG: hypothetical protein ABJD23_13615, partial [Nonlabens sp.]